MRRRLGLRIGCDANEAFRTERSGTNVFQFRQNWLTEARA
jgi:hypothetical protein